MGSRNAMARLVVMLVEGNGCLWQKYRPPGELAAIKTWCSCFGGKGAKTWLPRALSPDSWLGSLSLGPFTLVTC